MKKLFAIGLLVLTSQFATQDANAIENEQFWVCAGAVAGFDLTILATHQTCGFAISAPSPATFGACAISMGFTALAAGVAYLACDQFLEPGSCQGPGNQNTCNNNEDGSPILLDLDRNQFHLSGGPVFFDIDSDGQKELITWVAAGNQDGFLYLDRNGNGVVDSGLELFGDATLTVNLDLAENGYEALAEFDLRENGGFEDGVIDATDAVFARLRVWIDGNADGVSEPHETQSLAEAGVLSIGLDYRTSPRVDPFGNEFRYISSGLMEVSGEWKKMWTTDVYFAVLGNRSLELLYR